MKTKYIFFLLWSAFVTPVVGQQVKYEVELQALGTTNDVVPLWMRSNQFGSIPSSGGSGSLIGKAQKEYDSTKNKLFDWSAGFQIRGNAGKQSQVQLIEAYGKLKLGIFQLKGGRTRDIVGLNGDSLLTSGNFSVSGNALGIPSIELSIPNYYRLPVLSGIIAIKGNFSHGWVGKTKIRSVLGTDGTTGESYLSYTNSAKTFLHQKSLYGRLGKESWKINVYGGFNHQVYWGSESDILGPNFNLSGLETLFYVSTGKAYGSRNIARSKIGNHIGSIDLGFEYDFENVKFMVYRQNFYETGGLAKLANIRDGLNGITLLNKNPNTSKAIYWKKFLFEFLYTKHQAGERNSKSTNSGDEDYYNNYIYENGWSYEGLGLGTPLITSRKHTKEGLVNDPKDFFINNRVVGIHVGAMASTYKWTHFLKLTFSSNFGTFATSEEGRSTGNINFPPSYGIFGKKHQFSAYLNGEKFITNNTRIGYILACDQGEVLNNSFGVQVRLARTF